MSKVRAQIFMRASHANLLASLARKNRGKKVGGGGGGGGGPPPPPPRPCMLQGDILLPHRAALTEKPEYIYPYKFIVTWYLSLSVSYRAIAVGI
jgi:hypothetical protein